MKGHTPGPWLCAGFEPHPTAGDEYCVAPIYVDGKPRYCKQPRAAHTSEEYLKNAVQAAVEQNTSLIGELAKLKLEHSALAKALLVIARSDAAGSWCRDVAREALRLAGRLP